MSFMTEKPLIGKQLTGTLPADDILHLQAVSLRRDDQTLIKQVSASFDHPGISIFMGPNGAGKTLLLQLCHGMLRPCQGAVLRGKTSMQAPPADQALVFQNPVLLRRSVAANIAYPLQVRNMPAAKMNARVENALALVKLEDKAHRPARKLSSGERQRLALARAMVTRPKLLFLDEATANLDPGTVAHIEHLLQHLANNGTKIFLATHDVAQARRLGADIAFMYQGSLLEHTPAAQFFTRPQSRAARCFLDGRLVYS